MTARHSRQAAVVLGVLLAAGEAAYVVAGRAAVARAFARNDDRVLHHLLTGPSAVTLADYLEIADFWAIAIAIGIGATVVALALWPFADRAMERLYAWLGRACDACLSWRRLTLVAGSVICLAILSWVALGVLRDFPNSGDENGYLYEAETFTLGRVTNPAHALQAFFEQSWVREVDGRVFGIFPPGWPTVLALARVAHMPRWLVNPVLGCISLLLLFGVGRRLYDERTALLAVVVTFASSTFLFHGGSYFSHTFCSVLMLASAYLGTRAIDERRTAFAAWVGAVMGLALLTRNYTSIWCGLPFGLALLGKGRFGARALAAALAAGVPFVLIYIAYNAATTGHSFVTGLSGTFGSFDRQFFPPGWIGRAAENTGTRIVELMVWMPPAILGLYAWWWKATPRTRWRFTDFIFPSLFIGYFIYMDRGGNRYGPRFYYEALPLVALAAVAPLLREASYREKRAAGRFAFYAFVLSMVAALPLLAWHVRVESRVIRERQEPYRLAAEQRLNQAVVLVSTKSGYERPMNIMDLTRNGTGFSGSVLWALDFGPDNRRLMDYYPDRTFYRYRFDRLRRAGTIERVAAEPNR